MQSPYSRYSFRAHLPQEAESIQAPNTLNIQGIREKAKTQLLTTIVTKGRENTGLKRPRGSD